MRLLAKSLQSCPTLCNPMGCSLPGSSVHGTLQALHWNGLPWPLPGDLPNPGIEPMSLTSPALAGEFFTASATWEALPCLLGREVKVTQSCPTLCDPMDCTAHGTLKTRILEWVAISFSRASSQPRDRTYVSCV